MFSLISECLSFGTISEQNVEPFLFIRALIRPSENGDLTEQMLKEVNQNQTKQNSTDLNWTEHD